MDVPLNVVDQISDPDSNYTLCVLYYMKGHRSPKLLSSGSNFRQQCSHQICQRLKHGNVVVWWSSWNAYSNRDFYIRRKLVFFSYPVILLKDTHENVTWKVWLPPGYQYNSPPFLNIHYIFAGNVLNAKTSIMSIARNILLGWCGKYRSFHLIPKTPFRWMNPNVVPLNQDYSF